MSQKKDPQLFGLYVHWPYCLSKCPYCDFASCVTKNIDEDLLFSGYLRDLKIFSTDRPLTSIFFGGGTPSLMSQSFFSKLMNAIHDYYQLAADIEISMEANPDAINIEKMQFFKEIGVNRLSIGVQSLIPKELQFLGRRHSVERALSCIDEAKKTFSNINMDLIYARPHQTLKSWQTELSTALDLNLPHYSLYQLTIEEGTVFYHKQQQTISDNQARKLYTLTDRIMTDANFIPYEVSNYAKPGYECRHNLTYWLGQDYIGVGPAAHGRLGLLATENPRTVSAWLKQGTLTETLSSEQRLMEKVLMGLRLKTRYFPANQLNPANVTEAVQKKWITQTNLGIRPTPLGTLMLNQLVQLLLR